MIKLIKIIYDIQTKELTMYDVFYKFKEGEKLKIYPVMLIEANNSDDFYDPKGIVLYYKFNNYNDRFNEAEEYFYSLDINFKNIDYVDLQKYRLEIYRE